MNDKHAVRNMTLLLTACELSVCALTVLVYYLIGQLSVPVISGGLLGAAVMIGNFVALALISSHSLDRVLAERRDGQMSEEELLAFVGEHEARLKLRIRLSQTVRMLMMLAVLVVALLTPWFDVIATLVPMLLFRPCLMLIGLLMNRLGPKSVPEQTTPVACDESEETS